MAICNECRQEKPDEQVQLGICDDCFNYGNASSKTQATDPKHYVLKNGHGHIILTTSIDVPNREIERVISIVAAEAAIGMNVFRDIANNWRDFVGGRAASSQNALRETRESCLLDLRREAHAIGADAVIAVDLDYNQLNTSGSGGILFVAATGTAVKLKINPKTDDSTPSNHTAP